MYQPFFEIYVKNSMPGGSVVYWGLKRGFNDAGPYRYRLQWAETKEGAWEDVPTDPLIDVYYAVDPTKRMWAKELESYYRIILTTEEGSYTSFPIQSSGTWNKKEWLIARDVCRKEWLRLEKQVGVRGWLLKRKIWGPKCTACTDWDNPSDSGQSNCPICLGTGIVGGYWPGVPTYVDTDLIPRNKELDDNSGMKEGVVTKGRFFGYPHLATYDVFVDAKTDRRWVIRRVDNVAELRGQPLVYSAEMRLAPFTDPLYRAPVIPPNPSSQVSSSSAAPDEGVWPSDPPSISSSSSSSVSSSSSSSSSLFVSSSSSSSSSFTCPEYPPFDKGDWLWWDECGEYWMFGTINSLTVWYESTVDPTANYTLLPSLQWTPVSGTYPAPTVAHIPGGVKVTGAGAWWINGTYEIAGVHNGTYVYYGTNTSSSSSLKQ